MTTRDQIIEKPTIIVKIKGDNGKYIVWGIDWLNQNMLIERTCGYESISFKKITVLEFKLSALKSQLEEEPEITDEDIERWANNDIGKLFNANDIGPVLDVAYNSRIKGAKAMKDGKIPISRKDNIKNK